MAEKIELEIVTPERRVVAEVVDSLVLPSQDGELGVLPGHAPLLCRLTIGQVAYKKDGKEEIIAISGGFAEILGERVSVLAETAEFSAEIDLDRAKQAQERAEPRTRLEQTEWDFPRAKLALQKATNRISARQRAGL
jgi:F-type H+-transporting ATPase subunit epsilon